MSAPLRRNILVTGATGKQGRALIQSLTTHHPTHPLTLYALTRKPTSRTSLELAALPNVRLVTGDFSNPAAIFAQVPEPWGMFLMTMPLQGAALEERQGKALVKAGLEAGVKHVVFTATDRGKDVENDPTPIAHFASKFRIEKDLIAGVATANQQEKANEEVTYTILRPVAFYENLSPDFLGRAFVGMWTLSKPQSKIKFISTADVGRVGALAFLHSKEQGYKNAGISLAGEEIDIEEAGRIFKEVTGKEMVATYGVVARGLKWMLKEQVGTMFDWIRDVGFGVEVQTVRERFPFVMGFRQWLLEESAWKTEEKR
ncbi:unnamed protein product [Zymoseptoria tritici ST99CH_1E4]|uniref:NmrA-like domain-containing protein n=1 Tax=Zymoseptoria tritici ST99CH_1E4 TaxID=1276532 RepID=A0A2H1GT00_ZYMTR|nr:unnamed protein product [Zymoseptoria tritici ST99CH_1E4]